MKKTWLLLPLIIALLFTLPSLAEDAFHLDMPGSVPGGQDITVSWEEQDGLSFVILILRDSQDAYITEFSVPASPAQHTFTANYPAGDYVLLARPLDSDWNPLQPQDTVHTFSISENPPAAPTVSADKAEAYSMDKVLFTVHCPGAEKLRMRTAAYLNAHEYDVTGDTTEIEYVFREDMNAQFCALINGIWTLWSEPISIRLKTDGELEKPVLSMPASSRAGEEISVSWQNTEKAQHMNIRILDTENWAVHYDTAVDPALGSLVLNTSLPIGTYRLFATVYAPNMTENTAWAEFSITGDLQPGPDFHMSETEITRGNTVDFTVSMENATRFRLHYGRDTLEQDAPDGQAVISCAFPYEGTFECCISALTDGLWTAPGPSQTLYVLAYPQLEAPVVTLPEDVKAGENFTISWQEVPGATYYDLRIKPVSEENDGHSIGRTFQEGELSYTHINSKLPEGEYIVTVHANAPQHRSSVSAPMALTMLTPDPDQALLYQSFGMMGMTVTSVTIEDYLAAEVPEEVIIPETVSPARLIEQYAHLEHVEILEEGVTVSSLSALCLKNNGTLRFVTIPKCVTSIAENAFEGSKELTIRGYTGTAAEAFARLHGHTFEALDGGVGDVTLTVQSDPIYVNKAANFTLGFQGADEIRMYLDGEKCSYSDTAKGQNTLISKKITTPGTHFVNFHVVKDQEILYSPFLAVEVLSKGAMPPLDNMHGTASRFTPEDDGSITVERGTIVRATFTVPKGYDVISVGTLTPEYEDIFWIPNYYNVHDDKVGMNAERQIEYTLYGSQLLQAGENAFVVALYPEECYEETPTLLRIHVISTRPFEYLEDYQAIFNYQGTETDIQIPAQVDGLPVHGIYTEAFRDSPVTSVVIGEGIERIYPKAFVNCTQLTCITMPDSLTEIMESAFANCTALENITLPDQLAALPSALFRSCDQLREVHLPQNLNKLRASNDEQEYVSPFEDCRMLRHVYIPGENTQLERGSIPAGVTIHAPEGSPAHRYAESFGHPFECIQ